MDERNSLYLKNLEELGFYSGGKPASGVLDGDVLRDARKKPVDAEKIDRSFKYGAVLAPDKLGVTDIYELDGSACIYFKSIGAEPSKEQLREWQRAAWNHGLARMLWICTPSHIRVFNAFAPPPEDASGINAPEVLLFESIADHLKQLRKNFLAREQIESGEFWFGKIGSRIDRKTRIDEELADDLTLAASKLNELGLKSLLAHRLLLRTIFIAYLEAKDVLPEELFEDLEENTFEAVLSSAGKTKTFFARMRQMFNGDLFPPPPRDEALSKKLTNKLLTIPQCILARTNLTTFQQSFNFWRYDFSVIPIEVISSIYEKFIHAADSKKAQAAGTHYTPVNLVDFVLSQVFDDELYGRRLAVNAKVLDLACGSGVFLVEALRRLIARRLASGEKHTRDLVRDTLYNQVYGIDIEETAIEIAAFSLCLTAFELDPTPRSHHQLKFKEELKGRNLFAANAFDRESAFNNVAPFRGKQFDIIVGNPPWTRPKGVRSTSPGSKPLHVEYCRTRKPFPAPLPYRDPPDQAFVWRSQDFARKRARIGLLLEGKRFFSHEVESQQSKGALLRNFQPRLLVNLASLHDQKLFPTAKQPSLALIAENTTADDSSTFLFASVEFSRRFRNHGLLRLGPENVERLTVKLAADSPYALKVASWGSARDMAIVCRLCGEHQSLELLLASLDLEMNQGYIVGSGERNVPPELIGLPCLTGGRMPPFEFATRPLPKFTEKHLQWPRNATIYRGPLLLTASGLSGNRLVASFCQGDCVYSLSQYGVSFRRNTDRTLPHYLNAILNSSLATYFVFLTATKWGLEKYEILETDFQRLPVPDPTRIPAARLKQLLAVEERLRRTSLGGDLVEKSYDDLDDAVFDIYELEPHERQMVQDMLTLTIDLQRNHEHSESMKPPSSKESIVYATQLVSVIQPFLVTGKQRRLIATLYVAEAPVQVVRFDFVPFDDNAKPVTILKAQDLEPVLKDIEQNLDSRISLGIHTRRHLRVYNRNSVYVVKPAERRFWSGSAGLVDGDSVLQDLLARGGNVQL